MELKQSIDSLVRNLVLTKTPWKFVTCDGGELTVGTPIARVSLAGTLGAFWVRKDAGPPVRLLYGGAGGAVGLSLIPFPGNFSFSTPAMPSVGAIYRLPCGGKSLSLNELKGTFLMMELSADWGPGASGALMFLGGAPQLAVLAGPFVIPAFIATSKACVRFGGITATVLPVNAGATVYVGAIY